MLNLLLAMFSAGRSSLRSRGALVLENLALRQQLAVLRRRTKRPQLTRVDRAFWVALSRLWPKWRIALKTPNARGVAGDFDGDGDTDLALTGASGWQSIPVAFSNRNGSFRMTNAGVADFPAWTSDPAAKIVAGDFDGDGDADLAAVGGSNSRSIVFAISNRLGGFDAANLPMRYFPSWGNEARAVLAVRADTGATTDLMLVGGITWNSLPVAFMRK